MATSIGFQVRHQIIPDLPEHGAAEHAIRRLGPCRMAGRKARDQPARGLVPEQRPARIAVRAFIGQQLAQAPQALVIPVQPFDELCPGGTAFRRRQGEATRIDGDQQRSDVAIAVRGSVDPGTERLPSTASCCSVLPATRHVIGPAETKVTTCWRRSAWKCAPP